MSEFGTVGLFTTVGMVGHTQSPDEKSFEAVSIQPIEGLTA